MSTLLEDTRRTAKDVAIASQPPVANVRTRRRFRFRLRTLLLAPIIVVAVLLIAFPKLITGDFVEATVVSIESSGGAVVIEMDARISSGTSWGASLNPPGGQFNGLAMSTPWLRAGLISTWPKHATILVKLQVHASQPQQLQNPGESITLKQGESYHVTPEHWLQIAPDNCIFKVLPGTRLGLRNSDGL